VSFVVNGFHWKVWRQRNVCFWSATTLGSACSGVRNRIGARVGSTFERGRSRGRRLQLWMRLSHLQHSATPLMHRCRGAGPLFQYHTAHITCLTVHRCTPPFHRMVRQISRRNSPFASWSNRKVCHWHVVSDYLTPGIFYGVVIWNEHAATGTLHNSTWGRKRIQLPKRRVISRMIDDGQDQKPSNSKPCSTTRIP